jgi:hypothetical protein
MGFTWLTPFASVPPRAKGRGNHPGREHIVYCRGDFAEHIYCRPAFHRADDALNRIGVTQHIFDVFIQVLCDIRLARRINGTAFYLFVILCNRFKFGTGIFVAVRSDISRDVVGNEFLSVKIHAAVG